MTLISFNSSHVEEVLTLWKKCSLLISCKGSFKVMDLSPPDATTKRWYDNYKRLLTVMTSTSIILNMFFWLRSNVKTQNICDNMLQWMKHGSIKSLWNQNHCHSGRQQPMSISLIVRNTEIRWESYDPCISMSNGIKSICISKLGKIGPFVWEILVVANLQSIIRQSRKNHTSPMCQVMLLSF